MNDRQPDPAPVQTVIPADVADSVVACRDYAAHQSFQVYLGHRGGGWTCTVCHPPFDIPAPRNALQRAQDQDDQEGAS